MNKLKLICAATAAVTMTFTAQAAKTAKAVVEVEDDGTTLRFVYDEADYGTKGTKWFSVAEAEAIDPYRDVVPWYGCHEDVTKVVFDSSFAAYRPKQCGAWFYDFLVLAAVDGLKNLNTSVATNMTSMFSWCCELMTLDVTGFDTSNVTDMSSMFYGCLSLMTLDVTGFDTSNVTDMSSMFYRCSSLTTLDVSGFDTAKVTDMSSMFSDCSSLKTLDVSGFDTANVTDMDSMFCECESLTSLDLASFDTSKVTDMDYMFYGCSSLEAICASDRFVTDRVSDSGRMFEDCSKLVGGAGTKYNSAKTDKAYAHIDKAGWPGYFTMPTAKAVVQDGNKTLKFVYDAADYGTKGTDWFSVAEAEAIDPQTDDVPWASYGGRVTKVIFDPSFAGYRPTQCGSWFYGFSSLATIEGIKNLDTSEAANFAYMFDYCLTLTALDLSGFDTAKATDMHFMFADSKNLKTISVSDKFVTTKVADSSNMFKGCTALVGGNGTTYDSAKTDKTYARIDKTGAPGYFTKKEAKAVLADSGKTLKFVYDTADYGTKGTDWFSVAEAEAKSPSSSTPWLKIANGVTKVNFLQSFSGYKPKHCGSWFSGFKCLTTVVGLENLDTSAANSMHSMFYGCDALKSLNLSGFDTSRVTNMDYMFYSCDSLESLRLSGFDTSKVTSMEEMFAYCLSLKSLNLSSFNTAHLTSAAWMFEGCAALEEIAVSDKFVTTAVTSSSDMFRGCTALVGGAGTKYNSAKTDKTYARIDKTGQPGYFTEVPRSAKVVVEDGGKTLRFVYDSKEPSGTKGTDWFSVAEAEAIDPYDDVPWCGCGETVTNVVFDSSFAAYRPKQCGSWFFDFGFLAAVDGLKNLDTSDATNMAYMFGGCSSLTTLDVSRFDTAKVTSMHSMFGRCSSLTTLNLASFDTAKVTDMGYMFNCCSSLEAICASDRFVTDQVSYSYSMFENCSKLVGGAGTKYNGAKTNKAYACIDGKDGLPGYFTRGKTASAADDLNGDGRADIVMTIDDPSHPADGSTGAWLIQNDQTAAWGDLSQRNAGWDILGLGATTPNKATKDVYLVSPDNVVGAWVTDNAGKVTGWKTIDSFDAATTVGGLGDFNGDGQSDLLLVNDNGAVGCYFTSGKKTGWNYFQSLGSEWQICGIGDLNGDGRDDLVLLHDEGFAGSWLTQADGTMEWANLDTLQPGFAIVGCGDFDGDGTDDVLLRKGNYYGAWLVQDGQARGWMGLGDLGSVTVEQIADFDGDGCDDLRIRTANGDLGAELVKGEDSLTWAYYGSVGAEWLTEPLGLK